MSERKVLNKYYPPDFDPSKIPRMKLARNRQYTVRLMAPFNMRCKTCGEYIYKGKKFNARKEDVEGDDYLGIRIYRFYIKCTRCLQEISFKTDPKNTDYEIEAGATRNFMALKLAEEQAQREEDEEKEEEATNPMKLLEKRTLQSKQELELLESLEELKDLNRRQQTIDYDQMLEQFDTEGARQRTEKEQEELDEEYIKSVFGKKPPKANTGTVVEEEIIEVDESGEPSKKVIKVETELEEGRKQPNREKDVKEIESADISTSIASTTTTSASSTTFTWSDSVTKAAPKRTMLGLIKRQANLGVKTSVNDNQCSSQASNPDTEQVPQSSKSSETNTSETDIVSAPNNGNVHSGLSLLGAYSSSGSDSD